MYSAEEFMKKAKAGGFRLEASGHMIAGLRRQDNGEAFLEAICEKLQWYLDHYRKQIAAPEAKEDTLLYSRRMLEAMNSKSCIEIGVIPDCLGFSDYRCRLCETNFMPYLKDADTVDLGHWSPQGVAATAVEPCQFREGVRATTASIEIPSGTFTLRNYFSRDADTYLFEDTPVEAEYSKEYNICTPLGRGNVARHLASQSVAYCQTGNMTVHIYQHKKEDLVIVLDVDVRHLEYRIADCQEELADPDLDAEDQVSSQRALEIALNQQKLLGDYRYRGSISCGVWRIMGADQAVLDTIGYDPTQDEGAAISLKLKPGTWESTSFYDSVDYQGVMHQLKRISD